MAVLLWEIDKLAVGLNMNKLGHRLSILERRNTIQYDTIQCTTNVISCNTKNEASDTGRDHSLLR